MSNHSYVLQAKTGEKTVSVNLAWDYAIYEFKELYAKHKTNRIAKSGEVLYLLNNSAVNKIRYDIVTKPESVDISNIKNIKWYRDKTGSENMLGTNTKYFYRDIEKTNNTTTIVSAGNPENLIKSVETKWIDRDFIKYKFTLGTSASPFLKKALRLTEQTKSLTNKLEKLPFIKKINKGDLDAGVGYYFDIIPFQQTKENFEDIESRHCYTEKSTVGGFDIGLYGNVKWTIWGLPYEKLPLPDWLIEETRKYLVMEVYVVATAKAGGELKIKYKERKTIEALEWEEHSKLVDPALIKLNVGLGAGAEISLLKSNDYFSISGKATGIANAELLSIGWQKDKDFDVYFLREGVWIDIKADVVLILGGVRLDVEPYYKKIEIIEPN